MKYKVIINVIWFFLFHGYLHSQGNSLQMLYFFKQNMINPGVTGILPGTQIRTGYSRQLIGVQGGPEIRYIGAETAIHEKNIGIGINVLQDRNGPLAKNTLEGIFSYHINYDKKSLKNSNHHISLGISTFFHQYRLRIQDLYAIQEDPILYEIPEESLQINFNFGVFYFNEGFQLGFAAYDLAIFRVQTLSGLKEYYTYPQLFMQIGYLGKIGENFSVNPYLVSTTQFNGPLKSDFIISTIKHTKNSAYLELGSGYRHTFEYNQSFSEGLIVLFKVGVKDFLFGYQYLLPVSSTSSYSSGSHLVNIGMNLQSQQNKSGKLNKSKNINKPNKWF